MNQKVIVIILFVLFSLFGIIGYLISTNMDISKTGAYGAKIRFAKNEIIKFPDFELVYLGERKEYVPAYKGGNHLFRYHDFRIYPADTIVSWSSGTGDIGPVEFSVNGKTFWLELAFSDKLGKLESNEIVISVVSR